MPWGLVRYGYLFPVTVQGKIFTIAYACVAIPTTWGWMGFIGNLWIDLCRGLNRYTFVQCGIRNQKGGPKQRYTVLWMTLLVWAYVCAMGQVYMALPDKNDPSRRVPQGYLENVYVCQHFSFCDVLVPFPHAGRAKFPKLQWWIAVSIARRSA